MRLYAIRMRGIGLREAVGLGALAVALGIGFLFLNPAASESQNAAPGQVHLGETPTPAPSPTATPEPATELTAPSNSWLIQFYEVPITGGELLNGSGAAQTLDMSFAGPPFPDFHDDRWFLRASADFQVTDGLSRLTIVHDGDLRVLVDDKEVAHDADGPDAKTAEVTFRHAAGRAHVQIEARDEGGPFELKFGN